LWLQTKQRDVFDISTSREFTNILHPMSHELFLIHAARNGQTESALTKQSKRDATVYMFARRR